MPVHRPTRLLLAAAAVALTACSEPVRPAAPAPEVPVRPTAPAPPPPTAGPVGAPPVVAPPVAAARLPAPAAADDPAPRVAPPETPTPQDQGTGDVDRAITAALRAAIRERSELSAEAHALMVTTRDGVVTLRGMVADEPERDAVLSLAHALPEVQRVDDRLEPVVH